MDSAAESSASGEGANTLIALDPTDGLWERFFMVAPLVLVGTRGADGRYNVAPKHLAMPMAWENLYGFVCSPNHHTYQNVVAHPEFTVSFPRPDQIVASSLAAAPRWEDDSKPGLQAVPTVPARAVDGVLVANCSLYLECHLERLVEGLGANCLVVGRVVAAAIQEASLRTLDRDDNDLLAHAPLLAYVTPGRFATIDRTTAFPLPAGFSR
jgi:flavin reductase (DIM6/NTAB) family NADH-FMN oxidoreductase RutF